MNTSVLVFRGAGQCPSSNLRDLCHDLSIKEIFDIIEATMNERFKGVVHFDLLNTNDNEIMKSSWLWMPMNFITQSLNYYKFQRNKFEIFSGSIGHSQGIVSACIASLSETREEFIDNMTVGSIMMVYQGLRTHKLISDRDDDIGSRVVSIRGFTAEDIKAHIKHPPIIVNTRDNHVFAGTCSFIRDLKSKVEPFTTGIAHSKIIFDKRNPTAKVVDINISMIPHSQFNIDVIPILAEDTYDLKFSGKFRYNVYSTFDGSVLTDDDLIRNLFILQLIQPVNWVKCVQCSALDNVTTYIDCGPDGRSGLYNITKQNLYPFHRLLTVCDDYDEICKLTSNDFVASMFSGIEIRDGVICTKLTESLQCSPFWIAGMTPTTCNPVLVANAANVGAMAELAGGGYPTSDMFVNALRETSLLLNDGRTFGINIIYANPRLWNLQFPLAVSLKQAGLPISGITIGAGVPTIDVGADIIKKCADVGFTWIAFKPSTAESILHVIELSKIDKHINCIIQWTAGYAGGHHSYETFDDPLFSTYKKIRECENIILIAGSGIGEHTKAYSYLSGDWSAPYKMPFDGIMFGSAVMACKESRLSDDCKELLKNTPGTDEQNWTQTQESEIGGVTSIYSELGERIHVVANTGALVWNFIDKIIKAGTIESNKHVIIDKLKHYQKPYFGDLVLMTRQQVMDRYYYLTQHLNIVDFRMKYTQIVSLFSGFDPNGLLSQLEIDLFLGICKKPGTKVVPFVPIIDHNLTFWLKKDSLWYCENDHYDADRVILLQSPVTVKYITAVNIPIADFIQSNTASLASCVSSNKRMFYTAYVNNSACNLINDHGFEINLSKTTSIHQYNLYYKHLFCSSDDYVDDIQTTLDEFVRVTQISPNNAKFGYLCARSVSYTFKWMLHKFTFNPNGVIHIYQYFEKHSEPTVEDPVTFEPYINAVNHKGMRTEITVKSVMIQRGREIGFTVSCFGVQGYVLMDDNIQPNILDFTSNMKTSYSRRISLPNDDMAYANISRDYNPIHRIDWFATSSVFGFDRKIIHGMWTVSSILSVPHDVRKGMFKFVGPLYYKDEANDYITIRHDCVVDNTNRPIVNYSLDVRYKTGVCFAGQGSLSVKQGIKLYDTHVATRTVYNKCNDVVRDTFGIDILNILKFNPTEICVYINDINREYWNNTTDPFIIISHSDGLINFSPVTQVLTLLYEYCVYKRSNISGDIFCGHSLGEYVIPMLIFDVPIEDVIKLVFLRGLSMVDISNLHVDTPYRMIAVDPSRVGKTYIELQQCLKMTNEFVEIVNYNVRDKQYVIAGTKTGLRDVLSNFECNEQIDISKSRSGILLKGINIPFHSSYLKHKSDAFRSILYSAFTMSYDYTRLDGKYIPNLTGKPFHISQTYLQLMRAMDIENHNIKCLERDWDMHSDNERARIMLVELLSLQFCNAVNWIDTTEYISNNVDIVYEISPKSILLRMFSNPKNIEFIYVSEDTIRN